MFNRTNQRVDKEYRGRAMGIAITAGQGCGFLLAGALVDTGMDPAYAIALLGTAGTAGTAAAIATAPAWRRAQTTVDPARSTLIANRPFAQRL